MNSPMITADLTLDLVDSEGKASSPIVVGRSRLMALCLKAGGGEVWYGFIIAEADDSQIAPGCTVRVKLAFLDSDGSKSVFPNDASVLFGDGLVSRGVLVIRQNH